MDDLILAQKNVKNLVKTAPAHALLDFFSDYKYHQILEFFDTLEVELDSTDIIRLMDIFKPGLDEMAICLSKAIECQNLAIEYNLYQFIITGNEDLRPVIEQLYKQKNELQSYLDILIRNLYAGQFE